MKIAAFFDLDGTLLASPSLELRFFWFALTQGQIRFGLIEWLRECVTHGAAAFHQESPVKLAAIYANKSWISGIPERVVSEWTQENASALKFFEPALARLRWHLAQEHQVFLVSGTLAPLVRAAAATNEVLAKFEICATELETCGDCFTGRTSGAAVCGPQKCEAVRRLALRHGIDLSQSFAYGNAGADRWILASVGRPFAVNPDRQLAHLARKYGWVEVRWNFQEALWGL